MTTITLNVRIPITRLDKDFNRIRLEAAGTVDVSIDEQGIAWELARSAVRSKSGKATALHGLIKAYKRKETR
jgi:hypothetical protein